MFPYSHTRHPVEWASGNRSQVVTWSTDVNILDGVIYHEAKVESPSGISDKMEVNGQVDDGTVFFAASYVRIESCCLISLLTSDRPLMSPIKQGKMSTCMTHSRQLEV